MRYLVYLLAAAQTSLFILFAAHSGEMPDTAGNGWTTAFGIILALFLVPALALAVSGKAPWLSLALTLGPAAMVGLAIAAS